MGNAQQGVIHDPFDNDDVMNPAEYSGIPIEQLKRLLNALNETTFPRKKRLAMTAECLYEFDHKYQPQHDIEIREGAASALFQKLAFALGMAHGLTLTPSDLIPETESSESDHEIAMICTALEMVHRASDAGIEESFVAIGRDFLPTIVTVIERSYDKEEIRARLAARIGGVSKDRKIAVQKMTKVLAAYSLIPCAKVPIVETPGMLTCLVKVIDVCGFNRMGQGKDNIGEMTQVAQFNAVATLTNLAFAEETREKMLAEPSLPLSLSVVANSAKTEIARKCASLAITHLSGGDSALLPSISGHGYLLNTLVGLIKNKDPDTRSMAAVAIFNLANSDPKKTNLISKYGDDIVIRVLVEIVGGDETLFWNDNAKASAAESLFNMACGTNVETIKVMSNNPTLLQSLSNALISGVGSVDVLLYCAATLRRMAEIIQHPHPRHPQLLDTLAKVARRWTKTADIAQAFDIQASLPGHAPILAGRAAVLDALADLTALDGVALIRAYALNAMQTLSEDESVRPIMVKNENVMMALTRISYVGKSNQGSMDDASRLKIKNTFKNLVAAM